MLLAFGESFQRRSSIQMLPPSVAPPSLLEALSPGCACSVSHGLAILRLQLLSPSLLGALQPDVVQIYINIHIYLFIFRLPNINHGSKEPDSSLGRMNVNAGK